MNDLYLIGEDFEAILDYLENDGDLEEQFESSVSDVSTKLENVFLLFLLEHSKTRAHVLTQLTLACLFVVSIDRHCM